MGFYVHISVVFACDDNDELAPVAKKFLPKYTGEDGDFTRESGWFLEDLSKRTGKNPGPKGGLCTWGMVGNYTLVSDFVEELKPFWLALFEANVLCGHEHILVFEESEQKERATAYEIYREDDDGPIAVRKHECPFAWMQC